MKNIPIGEVLLEMGYITDLQLMDALAFQKSPNGAGKRLGAVMIEQGYVTEMQLLSALAKKMNIHIKPLDDIEIDFDAVKKISRKMAEKYCLIPVSIDGECLTIIMNDPLNFYAVEDVRLVTNMPVIVALDEKKKIERKIEICYGEIEAKQVVNIANESSTTSGNATSIEELGDMAAHELESGDDQRPVIKLLNSLLSHGYNINASDIHIEPFEKETRVRMRVDGMLIDYLILAKNLHPSLIARTKIMSN
ncbi:MAG: type II secretion system protein GspE, partial [Oscillospiraceae bacterium]